MKILRELALLLLFSVLGEGLRMAFDLPVPGSILGILLLFAALESKLIKVEHIDTTAQFLLNNLTIFFVPAGVALIKYYGAIKTTWPILLLALVICTVINLITVGKMVQLLQWLTAKTKKAEKEVEAEVEKVEHKVITELKRGEIHD
jgi:holin-like protein